MTTARTIETYLDTITESWQRSSFIDRLDGIRSMIANEGFPEGAEDAVDAFMALDPSQRDAVIQSLRIRNQVLDWAMSSSNADAILALIADLQGVAESKGE